MVHKEIYIFLKGNIHSSNKYDTDLIKINFLVPQDPQKKKKLIVVIEKQNVDMESFI